MGLRGDLFYHQKKIIHSWCKQMHIAPIWEVFALLRVASIYCRYLWEVYDLFGESKLLAAYVTIILHAWLQSTDFL